MPNRAAPLKGQCEEYVLSELARVGLARLDRAEVAQRFVALGASRTSIARWIESAIQIHEARAPAAPTADELRATAAARDKAMEAAAAAAAEAAPLPDARRELTALTAEAAAAGPEVLAADGSSVMERLERITQLTEKVLAGAFNPDGKVRNTKTALQAAEQLRRCLETAAKLYETMNNAGQVDRFMGEVMTCLREEAPETAKRVVERMRGVQGRWSAT